MSQPLSVSVFLLVGFPIDIRTSHRTFRYICVVSEQVFFLRETPVLTGLGDRALHGFLCKCWDYDHTKSIEHQPLSDNQTHCRAESLAFL